MAIRRNTSLVAVDFGTTTVRLLQVTGQHVTAMELPCEIFAGDPVHGSPDPGGLGADIQRSMTGGGFQGRRCAVTLPASCFLSDTIVLPELDDDDRADSLRWEAVDRFSVEHDDVAVGALRLRVPTGATIVNPGSGGSGTPAPAPLPAVPGGSAGTEHVLIALRRTTAMHALNPLVAAELTPVRVESAALAGLRTAWAHWARTSHEPLAFVHIEPTLATFLLARDQELVFHRAMPGQYQLATTTLSHKVTASSRLHATEPPPRPGATSTSGRAAAPAGDPDAIPVEVRSPAADRRAFRWSGLADEILQCLRYVERRGAGQWPGGLITSGPCAGQVELLATLESICGVPSHPASASGVVDPLPATLSPSLWASALGSAAVDLEQQTLLDGRRAA